MKYIVILITIAFLMISCTSSDDDDNNATSVDEDAVIKNISLTVLGSGNVQVSPDQQNYNVGDKVDLQAVPSDDWNFLEWDRDLSGTDNPTQLTVSESNVVVVKFKPQYELITDVEGNDYRVFQFGSQVWMIQNLNTSSLNNGEPIIQAQSVDEWMNAWESEQPAWAYYDGDTDLGDAYGKLYNTFAANNSKLCPEGWHIPSDEEWMILEMFLGMSEADAVLFNYRDPNVAENMMSYRISPQEHPRWDAVSPNSNKSGFSAIPGGYRVGIANPEYGQTQEGEFMKLEVEAPIWATDNSARAFVNNRGIYRGRDPGGFGFACRCIKDL